MFIFLRLLGMAARVLRRVVGIVGVFSGIGLGFWSGPLSSAVILGHARVMAKAPLFGGYP